MAKQWNGVWEKLLSVLLTANIAVMGWLWTALSRIADRLDGHVADRAIHREINLADLVGRREFEATRERETETARGLAERITKVEDRVDRSQARTAGGKG